MAKQVFDPTLAVTKPAVKQVCQTAHIGVPPAWALFGGSEEVIRWQKKTFKRIDLEPRGGLSL